MAVRATHRRQRRRAAQFGAPWSRTVKLVTVASVLIIIAVTVALQLFPSENSRADWVSWLVPAMLMAVFGVTSLFSVRGFKVAGRELWIQRTLWQTRFDLHDLKQAYADATAMKGSIRMAGNGGFLAFTGWFYSKKLGRYRAFVTDQNHCVVMEFKDRKIVVSPDDPEAFVRALGLEQGTDRGGLK